MLPLLRDRTGISWNDPLQVGAKVIDPGALPYGSRMARSVGLEPTILTMRAGPGLVKVVPALVVGLTLTLAAFATSLTAIGGGSIPSCCCGLPLRPLVPKWFASRNQLLLCLVPVDLFFVGKPTVLTAMLAGIFAVPTAVGPARSFCASFA